MQELEKILKEIEEAKNEHPYTCFPWYLKGLSNAEDIIRKHMNDGWIPVEKENLPDHEVLVCDRYGNEMFGYLSCDSDAGSVICDSDICSISNVIAWMEKPEPYRPERSSL